VRTGLTDAQWTEVVSGTVKPGTEIVTAIVDPEATRTAATSNIFRQTGLQRRRYRGR
jgi:hypothetical protein